MMKIYKLQNQMFKRVFISGFLFLIFISPVGLYARILPEQISQKIEGRSPDYERQKTLIINLVSKSLARLEDVTLKIAGNTQLDEETKNRIINDLNEITKKLEGYLTVVEAAESLEELQALNQEILNYLKDNKDAIREAIKEALVKLGEEAAKMAEELMEKVEQILKFFKLSCPEERGTIVQVESLLVEMENELAVLNDAIERRDSVAIKQSISRLQKMGSEMIVLVEQIYNNCEIPIDISN